MPHLQQQNPNKGIYGHGAIELSFILPQVQKGNIGKRRITRHYSYQIAKNRSNKLNMQLKAQQKGVPLHLLGLYSH